MSSPTLDHQELVYRLLTALKQYLATAKGIAVIASHDLEFALSDRTRVRPDVGAVLAEKAAMLDRGRVPVPGCPGLAIEVISPSEHTADSMRKVDACLQYGALEVWQVYPKSQTVVVYSSARTELLPCFSLPASAPFAA